MKKGRDELVRQLKIKKRSLYFWFSVCGVCIVCTLFVFYARNASERRFALKLHDAIQDAVLSDDSTFCMTNVTEFSWDRLFIFGPYTSASTIELTLGFSWPKAYKTGIDMNETFCLLVFTDNGKVVQHLMYPTKDGDFSQIHADDKIMPGACVFVVNWKYDDWLMVSLKKEE